MEGGRVTERAAGFARWVYDTYWGHLGLAGLEGGRGYRRFLKSADFASFPLSGTVRVQSFHIIKFGYPMRRAGYTTAVVTARTFGEEREAREAHIAYAYWPQPGAPGAPPEYICVSPTFESRDGEYRHHFLWYEQFDGGYEALAELLGPLEEAVLEALAGGGLELDLAFFPGGGAPEEAPAAQRLAVKAMVATLAHRVLGPGQAHSHPGHIRMMARLPPAVAAVLARDWSAAQKNRLRVFVVGVGGRARRAQCGQKMVPLTVREALQVGDLNFAPWREAWVSRRATDLVVNGAGPMFSIYNNWTVLAAGRGLFENAAMLERYDRSLWAEGVVASLRAARAAPPPAAPNYRSEQLDAHTYEALVYAQEHVQLTDLALCSTSEFVGATVQSLPQFLRTFPQAELSPAFLRMYAAPALQARYMFDLCYGAHALHTRVGAVHADLHTNNMTIHRLASQYQLRDGGYAPRVRNPVVAYVAGPRGEADTYVFPHDGWVATLIDFSRAILGPAARPQLAAERGAAFADGFYRAQAARALRVLHHYVPEFVLKHQEALKGLLLSRPDAMFRAMSAVDFLAVGRNYGALLRAEAARPRAPADKTHLEVAPAGVALAAPEAPAPQYIDDRAAAPW